MRRIITISLCFAVGMALTVAVLRQQNRIRLLKAERAELLTQLTEPAEILPTNAPAEPPDFKPNSQSPSIELLRLRAEVNRLGNRKRELASVSVESERLRTQFANRGTNVAGSFALPAGYIKKSQAMFVGYTTPEATLQSFFWALQNKDPSRLLEALGPEEAKQLESKLQNAASTDEFFKESDALPGMHILNKALVGDDTMVLTVETMPGVDSPVQLRFKQFGGEWKLVGGF